MTTISAIIPARGVVAEVARAVASIRAQTLPVSEIIVIDDASPVPITAEGLGLQPSQIRIERFDVNQGPSAARNAGIAAASGELVAFLDADDYWYPQKLERQVAHLLGAAAMTAVACGWNAVPKDGGATLTRVPIPSSDLLDFASGCWFSPGSTIVMRRSDCLMVGPFDPQLRRLEDVDWFLRFALAGGSLEVVREIGAVVSLHGRRHYADVRTAVETIGAKAYGALSDRWTAAHDRHLRSYLQLELASAANKEKRTFTTALHLGRSFLAVPRFSIPIREWWPQR